MGTIEQISFHLVAVKLPDGFLTSVQTFADEDGKAEGKTVLIDEEILRLAIKGAECRRMHTEKIKNPRRRK